MAVGNQPSDDIDESIGWTAVTGMFNLRNIFELINHAFNNGSLAQKQFVNQRHQTIFHVLLEARDELHVESVQ